MLTEVEKNKQIGEITVRECRPDEGKELLIHDGEYVIARHGHESISACGNDNLTMVTGTKEEVDAEIVSLNLIEF